MRTLSTLLVSSAVVAALLSGASMALRGTGPHDARGSVPAAQAPAASPSAQAWSDPPERAVPVVPAQAGSDKPVEAVRMPEPRPDGATPAAREAPRRVAARTDMPRRSEPARPPRRMAQASLRPRGPVPRAGAAVASVPPARPVDPISDFLRGVGLLGDDHG